MATKKEKKVKILIVDDDEPIRLLLRGILEANGYRCVMAADAAEGRQSLKEQNFELVLSDIQMPGETGMEFVQYVLSAYPKTAAIMVTGVDDPTVAKDALGIGVYDYIIKPIGRNKVLFSVANALRRGELEIENRAYKEQLESLVEIRTETLQKIIKKFETTQLALKDSELKYRQLVENANSIIIKLDVEGRVIFFNKFAQRFFGYTEDEILGQNTVGTIVSEKDYSGRDLREMIQDIIKNPEKYKNNENENTRQDGDRVWVGWANRAIFDKDGNVTEILCIGHNITDRKRAEQALLESEDKFRTISASAQDAIIMMDSEGKTSYWNAAAEKMFGFSVQEVLKKDLHTLIVSQQNYEAFQQCFCGVQATEKGAAGGQLIELTAQRKDKTEFPIELSLSAITLKDKCHALGIIRDISDRKILEAQLIQARKLESIGQLAAGIAHEINTPTQYVGDNIRFLEDAFDDLKSVFKSYAKLLEAVKSDGQFQTLIEKVETALETADLEYLEEEVPTAFEQSIEGVERVTKIVLSMKEFSHPGVEEKTPVNLNKAIESTITVASNEWKYVAEMETHFDQSAPPVPCLPGELNQVFLNMIVNAAHAIGDALPNNSNNKGKIRITTISNNHSVEIRISDTGCGIPPDIRHRIFDPFFTTKEVGKGTGQGLAIAHTVITEKHNGTITCESEEGQGTTFIIQLPLTDTQSTEEK